MTEHRWASIRRVAEYSGYSVRAIRNRIEDGSLPAYKATNSRVIRIDLHDVDALITAGGTMPCHHCAQGRHRDR